VIYAFSIKIRLGNKDIWYMYSICFFVLGFNNDCNFDVHNFSREAILRSFSRDTDDQQENEQDNAETEIALPDIGFLAVISECSSRLISQDKKTV
jgi:hypothetical protein